MLWWGTPAKAMPQQEWLAISADGAPPGVYVPNMSEADQFRWKARLAGQRTPGELRVEVRKSVSSPGTGRTHKENRGNRWGTFAQVLVLVYEDGEVRVSANGQMAFSPQDWAELATAVSEARKALARYREEKKGKGEGIGSPG